MNNSMISQTNPPNIFEELGFPAKESENLMIRADLMLNLRKLIQRQQWDFNQAADHLGESTATIESLLQGKIETFTIDQLITMHTHAGIKVRLEIPPQVA
jgi:predicted XRE-type DNA-binding protein